MKRRYLSTGEKARVIERQDHTCACGCKEQLEVGKIDFDHDIPLWTAQDEADLRRLNDLSNFRAMIRKHHKRKSNDENTRRAKADRQRARHEGTYLNARDRELARIFDRTKYLNRP